jgi:flagellar assembly factor FliW
MMMKIESPRFGALEVDQEKIIEFPAGLPGLEHCTRFSLFHEDGSEPVVFTLQSLDDPELALPIADPVRFGFHYELTLADEDVALLQLDSAEDAAVAVILRHADAQSPHRRASDPKVSANVMAPLVINTRQRRGMQQMMGKVGFDVTFRPVAQ